MQYVGMAFCMCGWRVRNGDLFYPLTNIFDVHVCRLCFVVFLLKQTMWKQVYHLRERMISALLSDT